jgi:phospholipid-translocating ATPase
LTKDEYMPADMLLLSSSIEDGTCYIDTVELDGETSLKTRHAVSLTQGFNTPEVNERDRAIYIDLFII